MLKVKTQVVSRAVLPLRAPGKNSPSLFLASGGWELAILDTPWLVSGSTAQFLPLSSHGCLPSVSESTSPFSYKTLVLCFRPTTIQYDLILINYICKDPISKYGHILKCQVNIELQGYTIQLIRCMSWHYKLVVLRYGIKTILAPFCTQKDTYIYLLCSLIYH